ncbi:hypothetical protein V6U89_12315 [Micromonospora sp. CPCC 206171]|uniref:hypothetical protein n=1 Tax=Micromonospora sp. CPCC 206171 TaxID=3122405 RepID=UPI002FF17044
MADAFGFIADLAPWSPWMPFALAIQQAPRLPGVYLARQRPTGPLVYVGMAGERRGLGIKGRLTVYYRGKAAVSGLGEAALDRALADLEWLRQRVAEVEAGHPRRAASWAQDAIHHADLYISWATTADRETAVALERQALTALASASLWNRDR